MLKTFQWSGFIVVMMIVISLLFTQAAFADEPCGDIVTTSDGEEFSEPIEDCDFPFGPIQTNDNLEISFQDIQLEDGGVYPIAGQSGAVVPSNVSPFAFGTVYKHRDSDFVVVGHTFGGSVPFIAGTYSIYVSEMELILVDSYLDTLKNFLIPTAHAALNDATVITFEVIEEVIEPEIDELILQYAPILYFHEDEDYFPMDVESFVEGSALWSKNGEDSQLHSSDSLTFDVFEGITASGDDTSDMYLAFSSPDTARTIDLASAKAKYDSIKKDDPTVYYHKMTDTTDYGKTFTVLQYWYFYAMNNWGEQGGYNDHEGDWESTFVFLNDDEDPEYVAYSSHLNDQYAFNNIKQYSSVRRAWDSEDVGKDGGRVKDYVALGSHANYANLNKLNNTVPTPHGFKFDQVSSSGNIAFTNLSSLTSISLQDWAEYKGLFGTFTNQEGFSGPQGPTHINVTTQTRYSEPIEWAGLNNFFKLAVNTATDTVEDTKQGIKMVFDVLLSIGTNIVIERYDEYITFSTNVAEFNPLPYFFEVTSDTDTSGLTMTLSYDPEYLESTGQLAEDLVILYHNPVTDLLEVLDSVVDIEAHTVTAYTPHMSRYLLGFQDKEEVVATSTASTTHQEESRTEHNYGSRINRGNTPVPEVLGASVSIVSSDELEELVFMITQLSESYLIMNSTQKEALQIILRDTVFLLDSLRK
jgi:hypothetical protein